jgi:hypothetical protein
VGAAISDAIINHEEGDMEYLLARVVSRNDQLLRGRTRPRLRSFASK